MRMDPRGTRKFSPILPAEARADEPGGGCPDSAIVALLQFG